MVKKMLVAAVVGMGLLAAAGTASADPKVIQELFNKAGKLRDVGCADCNRASRR